MSKPTPYYTQAECEHIALNKAGELYINVKQYDQIDLPPDWSWRRVATMGMGNCGSAVLIGRTKAARELLRQGKIKLLMQQHPRLTAAMADVCVSTHRGMESPVVAAAIEQQSNPLWHAEWEKGSWEDFLYLGGIDNAATNMSCPRWLCAQTIVREWWRTGAVDAPKVVEFFDKRGNRLKLATQSRPAHVEGAATFNPFRAALEGLKK